MDDGDDVLDQTREGKCPNCGGRVTASWDDVTDWDEEDMPHVTIEVEWCVLCGWEPGDDEEE